MSYLRSARLIFGFHITLCSKNAQKQNSSHEKTQQMDKQSARSSQRSNIKGEILSKFHFSYSSDCFVAGAFFLLPSFFPLAVHENIAMVAVYK